MVPELRKQFNARFSPERHAAFLHDLDQAYAYPTDFRVSETPIFLSRDLTNELVKEVYEIFTALQSDDFKVHAAQALPSDMYVPNEHPHPRFIQFDFAICKNQNESYSPRLIELQSFPSLYCFQLHLAESFRKHYDIPENLVPLFNGLTREDYLTRLKTTIIADKDPENVILLEIDPPHQKTRIDFACTEAMLGIRTVDISHVIKRGKKLYYASEGKEIPIDRVYNRVVFDELMRKNPPRSFRFTEELDVHWVGHPNWYFKISKHTLPFLKTRYAVPCFFLSDLQEYPSDLDHYVLKPLFSFAGTGVEVDVTRKLLDSIQDRSNYILQQKVDYAPLIETPDQPSKAEIRMMFLWHDAPMLVNNLVRLSKGKMMGVNFNKDKTWVGSSVAFHP